jgi:formate hydrogenlyase subunit 3/multisubunit Na+/H+ antiporter MnhD subunit
LGFFDRYSWLRTSDFAYPLLLMAGGVTTLLGGLLAAGERHHGRMLGYAAMVSTGFGLQALGLGGAQSAQVFFALLLPQAFAIWGWATSLSMLSAANVEGLPAEAAEKIQTRPLVAAVWLMAVFSLGGLPLLGSFPGRLALLDGVAAASPLAAASGLIGSLGLLAAGVRLLVTGLESAQTEKRQWVEEAEPAPVRAEASDVSNPYVWVFAMVAMISLLGFGLLPRLFLSAVPDLAALFSQLSP